MEQPTVSDNVRNFPVDTVLLVLFVIGYSSIGFYYRWKGNIKTMAGFVYGENKIPTIPITLAVATTIFNAEFITVTITEASTRGTPTFSNLLGFIIGTFLGVYGFSSVFYKTKCTTVFEYLEMRFGVILRKIASVHFLIGATIASSLSMAVLAKIMNSITGLSLFFSTVLTTFAAHLYYAMGGIKAVICVSALQRVMLFSGLILFLAITSIEVGGWKIIWKRLREGGRIRNIEIGIDVTKDAFWAVTLTNVLLFLYLSGISPVQHQLACCCKTFKSYTRSLLLGNLVNITAVIILYFLGIVMYASMYVRTCETIAKKQDMPYVLPHFIYKHCTQKHGMYGIVIPAIAYNSVTSVASTLSVLTFVTLIDLVVPMFPAEHITETRQILMIKFLSNLYTGMIFFTTFSIATIEGLHEFARILVKGFVSTQCAIFVLGLLFKRPNQKGVLIAAILGYAFVLWTGLGEITTLQSRPPSVLRCINSKEIPGNGTAFFPFFIDPDRFKRNDNDTSEMRRPSPLYRMTTKWVTISSFLIIILAGYVFSIFTGSKQEIETTLLSPVTKFWLEKDALDKFWTRRKPVTKFLLRRKHTSKQKATTKSAMRTSKKSLPKKSRKSKMPKRSSQNRKSRKSELSLLEENSKRSSRGSRNRSQRKSKWDSQRVNAKPPTMGHLEEKIQHRTSAAISNSKKSTESRKHVIESPERNGQFHFPIKKLSSNNYSTQKENYNIVLESAEVKTQPCDSFT